MERRPYSTDPTAVDHTRVSESSTISNGGLGGGRPEGGATVTPERARYQDESGHGPDVRGGGDVPDRTRARQDETDQVLPADDATLNTKI